MFQEVSIFTCNSGKKQIFRSFKYTVASVNLGGSVNKKRHNSTIKLKRKHHVLAFPLFVMNWCDA